MGLVRSLAAVTFGACFFCLISAFYAPPTKDGLLQHLDRRPYTGPQLRRRVFLTPVLLQKNGEGEKNDDELIPYDLSKPMDLEKELDLIDDITMGRSEMERDQVKVYGAWLDADIAGRKAGDNRKIKAKLARGERLAPEERGEIFFEEAVKAMNRGRYAESVALIEQAVRYAGRESTRGGGFRLWLAQAVYAQGCREGAREGLKALGTHPDSNIRRVAAELLYIYEAPEIKLTKDDFVEFPDMSTITEKFDRKAFRQGEMSKGSYSTYKEKEPVYYDWDAERPVLEPNDTRNFITFVIFSIFSAGYFAVLSQ
mmetsp:Transcript_22067/g.34699  ORF Transcript_22067/g.34699 Transcript_22067/m.34699 type:complete len:312 (+) Transcript_22067:1-936(+)